MSFIKKHEAKDKQKKANKKIEMQNCHFL